MKPSLILAAVLVVTVSACSDDPADSGKVDVIPPGIERVTTRDIYHFDVTFNEEISVTTAERAANYTLTGIAPRSTTEKPVPITAAVLKPDGKTVSISTAVTTSGLKLRLQADGIADIRGNVIPSPVSATFMGSNMADLVAPTILSRSPGLGDVDFPIGGSVVIRFSERIEHLAAFWESERGSIWSGVQVQGATVIVTPDELLTYDTGQWIILLGVKDQSGNEMAQTSWSFRTTRTVDRVAPEITTTVPADRSENVDVNADLKVTFTEPMNAYKLYLDITPYPGEGDFFASNGGKTITYDLARPLEESRQYRMKVFPGAATDLAGNSITTTRTIVFATGGDLQRGRISGTVAGGGGSAAFDPTGGEVIARERQYYVEARTMVAEDDTYEISYLDDGAYEVGAFVDSNSDGELNGWMGDAFGFYGMDFETGDLSPDSVVITGGSQLAGIDFSLHDPSALTGRIAYSGSYENSYTIRVGLFNAATFEPASLTGPVAVTFAWWPGSIDWHFNTVIDSIPDGDYCLAAFLDANRNFIFDPGVDPMGVYGGLSAPTILHLDNGNDLFDLMLTLNGPELSGSGTSTEWPAREPNPTMRRLRELMEAPVVKLDKEVSR